MRDAAFGRLYTALMLLLLGFVLASLKFSEVDFEKRSYDLAATELSSLSIKELQDLSETELNSSFEPFHELVMNHDLRLRILVPASFLSTEESPELRRITNALAENEFPEESFFFEFGSEAENELAIECLIDRELIATNQERQHEAV